MSQSRPSHGSPHEALERLYAGNERFAAGKPSAPNRVLAKLIREGKLIVAGGVYDLQTGKVLPVELGLSVE